MNTAISSALLRAMLALCMFMALACPPPAAPDRRTVSLRMSGGPADSRVTIDDEMVGSLDVVIARGVALPVGTHRVSVERDGYFPCDKLVVVQEGDADAHKLMRVECTLVPVPE